MNSSLFAVTVVVLTLAFPWPVSGPPSPQEAPGAPTQDEMMKLFAKYTKPGKAHERLAELVGVWETEMTVAGMPGAPSKPTHGTAEYAWLFPGRWLRQSAKGSMMGMPYETHGLLGFDNFKKKYVGSFCDTMSTALLHFEGNFDQSDKTLLCYGLMDEYMTGEHDKCVKYVWRWKDADHFVFEIHDLPIGETNTKVIEISYRRKKG